jgi:hypothetical protein
MEVLYRAFSTVQDGKCANAGPMVGFLQRRAGSLLAHEGI